MKYKREIKLASTLIANVTKINLSIWFQMDKFIFIRNGRYAPFVTKTLKRIVVLMFLSETELCSVCNIKLA